MSRLFFWLQMGRAAVALLSFSLRLGGWLLYPAYVLALHLSAVAALIPSEAMISALE